MREPEAPSRNPFATAGFARWWMASMVAGTGVGIQTVSVPLFIRDRAAEGQRAAAIAAALVAQTLPGALFALLGGAVADRVERRRILVRSYGVAAAVATVYVALAGFDVRVIWPVFPLAMLIGSAGAFTNPARQSLLPLLVSRPQLQNAVILGNMGFMASLQFLGPIVAGFVGDGSGLTAAFSLEVALLLAGAVLFAGVRTPPPQPTDRSALQDLVAGLRYVAGEPELRGLLALGSVVGVFFIGPFAVTVPLVVPDVFGASDRWVGILWGCFGVGVFAGSLVLTFRPLPRRGLAVCLANVSGGVVLWLYGQTQSLAVASALLVVWGLGASVFMSFVVALLQERAEPAMMGRVMSEVAACGGCLGSWETSPPAAFPQEHVLAGVLRLHAARLCPGGARERRLRAAGEPRVQRRPGDRHRPARPGGHALGACAALRRRGRDAQRGARSRVA